MLAVQGWPVMLAGMYHSSRRSSSTGQQAGEQEKGEGEEGAVSAIVDKLCKDLQVDRVSKSWTILLNSICILH